LRGPYLNRLQSRGIEAMIVISAILLYAATGLVVAAAFVTFGVTRVLPAPMTPGARILIVPGAAALWPYVLLRWLRAMR
jgi:hypothetical protein